MDGYYFVNYHVLSRETFDWDCGPLKRGPRGENRIHPQLVD